MTQGFNNNSSRYFGTFQPNDLMLSDTNATHYMLYVWFEEPVTNTGNPSMLFDATDTGC